MYYVKNKSGNVSDVTEKIYRQRQKNKEYECWIEDPYKAIPEQTQEINRSANYTVKEVRELAEGMSSDELREFIGDDERVTVQALIE